MESATPFLTICTPTYNRASTLSRLFESLCAQDSRAFEWLVWDDGSTDGTPELLEAFAARARFPFRHYRGTNGGKHRAINRALPLAKGEAFFIVDSDDWVLEGAVEAIAAAWPRVTGDEGLCGLVGYRAYSDERLVSDPFPVGVTACDQLELRYGYGVRGDKAEVFKTAVLRDFPFPEIEGESFINEAVVWNRIASRGKLLLLDKAIYGCEYLQGGLSDRSLELRASNPKGSLLYYGELLGHRLPWKARARAVANYARFSARYALRAGREFILNITR